MTSRLSDALALDYRALLTMHASPGRGIAFALGDRFYLAPAARLARQAGVRGTVVIAAAPQRHGGRA
jgi:hypothetical protein